MESVQEMRSVAKVRDAHGIRGEVFLVSKNNQFDWINEVNSLCLTQKKLDENKKWQSYSKIFEIQKFKKHKVGIIVKFKEVTDRNFAETLQGAVVEVPESIFQEVKEDGSYYLSMLKEFQLYDESKNLIGIVTGFSSNGAQDLLEISKDTKTFSIPYVDPLILKKNFKERWLQMKIPDGLIDVDASSKE